MHKIQFSLAVKPNICIRHVITLGYIFNNYIAEWLFVVLVHKHYLRDKCF